MSESFTIHEGKTYEHDEYGEVELMNIFENTVGLEITRNDERTTKRVEKRTRIQVQFMYTDKEGVDQVAKQKIENFQFNLSEVAE